MISGLLQVPVRDPDLAGSGPAEGPCAGGLQQDGEGDGALRGVHPQAAGEGAVSGSQMMRIQVA